MRISNGGDQMGITWSESNNPSLHETRAVQTDTRPRPHGLTEVRMSVLGLSQPPEDVGDEDH